MRAGHGQRKRPRMGRRGRMQGYPWKVAHPSKAFISLPLLHAAGREGPHKPGDSVTDPCACPRAHPRHLSPAVPAPWGAT
eukprot:6994181-Pyramimonas_sp.AAC.1